VLGPATAILMAAAILPAALSSGSCRSRERVYIIKAALSQNPGQPQVRAAELFKRLVERDSAGGVRVDLYPNNQLGNQRDVIEGIQLGTIEMSNVAAPLASFVPQLNLFELPFLFENREHLYAVLDSEIGRSLIPDLEQRGFRLLGYFDAGVRHIMTTHRPVNALSDLQGLKIRTMENPLHLAAFKALGANPLPMAYGELYTALEQGVIDGAEAAGPNYLAKKFYEPAPHWAQVGWIHLVEYVVMSRVFYERLPQSYRDVVDRAAGEMIQRERQWYRAEEAAAREALARAGVSFTYPDLAPFRRSARQVYLEWADRVGGLPLIERILSYPHGPQTTNR
jgi:tripartite ATP-independent transporter DctP family solute receptor